MKYFIIASGFNSYDKVEDCFNSLIKLEADHEWSAILIDDGSTDEGKMKEALNKLPFDSRIETRHYLENKGAAFRRFQAIKEAELNEEDVIILLGLDDELLPNAINEIDRKYLTGAWMTYGNWISPDGFRLDSSFLHFDDNIHVERSYRRERYRSTAPNTFKKFLFDQFTERDFMYNEEWIKATTESNLMLSCLEMCGKARIGVIDEPIYVYNRDRKDNAKYRFGRHYQDDIYKWVKARPKRELLIR